MNTIISRSNGTGKIGAQGNSGFLYHVQEGPKYKAPFETGPEYQLIDDDNYPWVSETGKEGLEDWQKTGCNYAMYVPETKQVTLRENGTPLWYFTRMDMLSTG